MEYQEYEEEIKLIREQNDTEFEIYPLAVEIIQDTLENFSKRYVFARKLSKKGQIYYGLSSFPDVAILDRDFKNNELEKIRRKDWDKLRGCIEVKSLDEELLKNSEIESVFYNGRFKINNQDRWKDIVRLIGEILWYKKVIYTNGIEWRLLYIENYDKKLINRIIETVNERIRVGKENYNWWESFENFDFKIVDECITDNCLKHWEDFISNINKIEWINRVKENDKLF